MFKLSIDNRMDHLSIRVMKSLHRELEAQDAVPLKSAAPDVMVSVIVKLDCK